MRRETLEISVCCTSFTILSLALIILPMYYSAVFKERAATTWLRGAGARIPRFLSKGLFSLLLLLLFLATAAQLRGNSAIIGDECEEEEWWINDPVARSVAYVIGCNGETFRYHRI